MGRIARPQASESVDWYPTACRVRTGRPSSACAGGSELDDRREAAPDGPRAAERRQGGVRCVRGSFITSAMPASRARLSGHSIHEKSTVVVRRQGPAEVTGNLLHLARMLKDAGASPPTATSDASTTRTPSTAERARTAQGSRLPGGRPPATCVPDLGSSAAGGGVGRRWAASSLVSGTIHEPGSCLPWHRVSHDPAPPCRAPGRRALPPGSRRRACRMRRVAGRRAPGFALLRAGGRRSIDVADGRGRVPAAPGQHQGGPHCAALRREAHGGRPAGAWPLDANPA